MRRKLAICALLVSMAVAIPAAGAPGVDLHWLWDDRCAECHGHAGDFARKFLTASSGELHGRHYVHDLRQFLYNHYLSGNEVDAVYSMLLAQAESQARFRDECSECHDTAANFVRGSLELRDGVLCSRNSGCQVRDFLGHHRGLNAADADFYMHLLTRVANEVFRP